MEKFTVLTGVAAPMLMVNINTDLIAPSHFPGKKPEEAVLMAFRDKMFANLRYFPDGSRKPDFVLDQPRYSGARFLLAGPNFGCGSSREHAPIALGSAGCRVVLAESFARIFFRNSVATGELYPCELTKRLCNVLKTGDVVKVDLDAQTVTVKSAGEIFKFKPLGDVRPVVDAGGLFNYARQSGMIAK